MIISVSPLFLKLGQRKEQNYRIVSRDLYCSDAPDDEEIKNRSRKIVGKMYLDLETLQYVESTKLLSNLINWHEVRVGRITASVVYDILHTSMSQPAQSLIKKICKQPSRNASIAVPSLKWGINNKPVVLQKYKALMEYFWGTFKI